MEPITTFIIPSIERPTTQRSINSVEANKESHHWLLGIDHLREGEGIIRNRLIEQANTPWVSMLDDDDTVTSDYVARLKEMVSRHPEADVIIFREYFLHGVILPAWPVVEFGNIPVSFSVRTTTAKEYPFKSEPHEDFYFIQRLYEAGRQIFFSEYLTYKARH